MAPTRQDQRSGCLRGGKDPAHEALVTTRIDEVDDLDRLFEESLPAFGGAFLRKAWLLLDEAVGRGIPMTLSVAGPVTLSGQALTWLNPLLDTGWFCLISTTDAVCYHDGHRALDGAQANPIRHVGLEEDDGALRDERTIRVTDVAFPEDVLLEQDRFLRAVLRRPEFQRRMSGPEFRHLLGRRYAAQERKNGVPEGLLALCHRKAIPVFVGAPGDGSIFLNSVELWARRESGGADHRFEIDLHREVFESCAFHRWATEHSDAKAIGALILGGGVPKNFNLQPEPTLGQVLGFEGVPGYLYDIQITTAPVTDGSLSSCPPAEAVTWGKVDKDEYRSTCVSLQADYTTVMPFLAKALLDKRARFARWCERMGEDELFAKHPAARGYLRHPAGYRLMDRREELSVALLDEVRALKAEQGADDYPLAPLDPIDEGPRPVMSDDVQEGEKLAPYKIEEARSSRSRCRTCRRKIDKGKLRLGVLLEGPYGTGYLWHHLTCAAKRRADDVEEAYAQEAWEPDVEVPPLDELRALREKAEEEKRNKKELPHAERAPSDRSKCKHCDEKIEKGAFRVVLAREISFGRQVRSMPIKVHPRCVAAELRAEDCQTEAEGFADAIRANTPELSEEEAVELFALIGDLD